MSASTQDVLNHHLEAFGAQDIDAILADYSADSFLITPMGTARGLDELRVTFETLWKEYFATVEAFDLQVSECEGEIAYITWSAESGTHSFPLGTDTFVIRDGKIVAQTFAGIINEK